MTELAHLMMMMMMMLIEAEIIKNAEAGVTYLSAC